MHIKLTGPGNRHITRCNYIAFIVLINRQRCITGNGCQITRFSGIRTRRHSNSCALRATIISLEHFRLTFSIYNRCTLYINSRAATCKDARATFIRYCFNFKRCRTINRYLAICLAINAIHFTFVIARSSF